jgi:trafficking protein particle complex subunit 5
LKFQSFFGREADKLEHSNDDDSTYYIIEKEPLVNKFISVPKDKGNLNCAVFVGGIIEGILNSSGFVSTNYLYYHHLIDEILKIVNSI